MNPASALIKCNEKIREQPGTQLELHPFPRRTILGKYNFERITTRKHNHKWVGPTTAVLGFGPVRIGKRVRWQQKMECRSSTWPLSVSLSFRHSATT